MAEIRSGSRDAFARLYDAYAPALLGYISKTVADTATAEGILQNVFIAIWNTRHAIAAEPVFTTLLGITRKAVRTFLAENEVLQNQNITSFVNMHNIEAAQVEGGSARAVLHELYYNGCSIDDAAARLNIEKDKLKMALRQAVNNLKSVPQ